MNETYKMFCFKCANKVHKELEYTDITNIDSEAELVLTTVSYKCDKCGYINTYKDMFYNYK